MWSQTAVFIATHEKLNEELANALRPKFEAELALLESEPARARMAAWRQSPVAGTGSEARLRLAELNMECTMQMLWL